MKKLNISHLFAVNIAIHNLQRNYMSSCFQLAYAKCRILSDCIDERLRLSSIHKPLMNIIYMVARTRFSPKIPKYIYHALFQQCMAFDLEKNGHR